MLHLLLDHPDSAKLPGTLKQLLPRYPHWSRSYAMSYLDDDQVRPPPPDRRAGSLALV